MESTMAEAIKTPQTATGGRNAVTLFNERVAASSESPVLRRKVNGQWQWTTWAEWDLISSEIAAGLASLGVSLGDRVALISNTRPEWMFADIGILMAGAVTVPIYQSNLAS